ncbi:MAG: hypothetical protein BGN86_09640 [Caulobacterales bacterium 68-7]|nr:hypothetical protein [Caulobacterales bacterium]OJU11007.1 MAG: hypothetical protein BGN86_09640 [Caulobacterales bacterium 68-7]
MKRTLPILMVSTLALALAACGEQKPAAPPPQQPTAADPTPNYPQVEPPAPGTPGGFPDDRTPISEAPFTPESEQGAADVVQTYAAHIGQKDYGAAYALLRNPTQTAVQFTQGFGKYYQYNMQVGSPGRIEGAAGSLFIQVPVLIYGRLKTGETVNELGSATLRRSNNVDGSTPEQRLWRIEKFETKPTEASGVANG